MTVPLVNFPEDMLSDQPKVLSRRVGRPYYLKG